MEYRRCSNKSCNKLFTHPDVYHGRCEDCYAEVCAREDHVSRQTRKSAPGEAASFHELHTNGPYKQQHHQGGKVTIW